MDATNKSIPRTFELQHQQLSQITPYSTQYPAFTLMNQQQIYDSLTQLITQWKLNPQRSLPQNSNNRIALPSIDPLSCQWKSYHNNSYTNTNIPTFISNVHLGVESVSTRSSSYYTNVHSFGSRLENDAYESVNIEDFGKTYEDVYSFHSELGHAFASARTEDFATTNKNVLSFDSQVHNAFKSANIEEFPNL